VVPRVLVLPRGFRAGVFLVLEAILLRRRAVDFPLPRLVLLCDRDREVDLDFPLDRVVFLRFCAIILTPIIAHLV
jgi:hypothetical protein